MHLPRGEKITVPRFWAWVLIAVLVVIASGYFGAYALIVVGFGVIGLIVAGALIALLVSVLRDQFRWKKMIERERLGLCRRCGYDVSGCVDRCSECGAIILR